MNINESEGSMLEYLKSIPLDKLKKDFEETKKQFPTGVSVLDLIDSFNQLDDVDTVNGVETVNPPM